MNQREKYPDWFLWMWDKGPFLFFGAGAVMALTVIVAGMYFDSRLDGIEQQLVQVPPRSYQPPDLEKYAAGDISQVDLSAGDLIYVPVYSHIYYDGGSPCPLESTLSIRNIDLDQPLYVKSVKYFDTDGQLVKSHLDRTIRLAPLATIEFLVERRDSSGGSGANFLVEWVATDGVDRPLIQTVMVGAVGTQGICFHSDGIGISPSSDSAAE